MSSDTGPVVYKIISDGTIKSSSPISDPDGIAVDSQDRVFVAGSNRITMVNSFEGGSDIIFASGFRNLDAIAIDSQDDMVVLDGEHYVLKIFKETGAIEELYYISGWSTDVEFNANDELFISGGNPEQLIKIDLSGNIDFIIPPIPGSDYFSAMEFGPGGAFGTDLFILTPRGIEIVNQNGQRTTFATPTHRLYGISFSPLGDMYLSEFTTPGRIFRVFPVLEANEPGDLDGDGDVDRDDLQFILDARNQPADDETYGEGNDPRDLDGDGMITALDARKLVLLCTCPRCVCE